MVERNLLTVIKIAKLLGENASITTTNSQGGDRLYCVDIPHTWIKEGSMKISAWGGGLTIDHACIDYLTKINGSTLICDKLGGKEISFALIQNEGGY